jgi:hypothetical protein
MCKTVKLCKTRPNITTRTLLFMFTRGRQDDFRIGGAIFGVGQELQRPGLSTPHCRGSRHQNKLGNNQTTENIFLVKCWFCKIELNPPPNS